MKMRFGKLNFTALLVVLAFLALCVSAKEEKQKTPKYYPIQYGRGIELNRNANVSQALINETVLNHPDCTFHDGHGDVRCNMWSFVWDYRGKMFLTGAGWFERFDTGCYDHDLGTNNMDLQPGAKMKLDMWFQYQTSLPYQLKVHPGNGCMQVNKGQYDNMWIEYLELFINAPDSPRCSRVGRSNMEQRCLIPLYP